MLSKPVCMGQEMSNFQFDLGDDDVDLYEDLEDFDDATLQQPTRQLSKQEMSVINDLKRVEKDEQKGFWDFSSDDDKPADDDELAELRKQIQGLRNSTSPPPKIIKPKTPTYEENKLAWARALILSWPDNQPLPEFRDPVQNQILKDVAAVLRPHKNKLQQAQEKKEQDWEKTWQDFVSNYKIKRDLSWRYTERPAWCYDCETMIMSNKKGYGEGLQGGILYFCHGCYQERFDRGEETPIDMENEIPTGNYAMVERYMMRKEFSYHEKMISSLKERMSALVLSNKAKQNQQSGETESNPRKVGRFTVLDKVKKKKTQ